MEEGEGRRGEAKSTGDFPRLIRNGRGVNLLRYHPGKESNIYRFLRGEKMYRSRRKRAAIKSSSRPRNIYERKRLETFLPLEHRLTIFLPVFAPRNHRISSHSRRGEL